MAIRCHVLVALSLRERKAHVLVALSLRERKAQTRTK
jgi:hypothetical protein